MVLHVSYKVCVSLVEWFLVLMERWLFNRLGNGGELIYTPSRLLLDRLSPNLTCTQTQTHTHKLLQDYSTPCALNTYRSSTFSAAVFSLLPVD